MSYNKHHYCPHCGKRKMYTHHDQKNKIESSSSSSSSSSCSSSSSSSTSSLGCKERWVPEFLGTGSGTANWRSARRCIDESSIEIIDHTTFTRKYWRKGRSK